MIERDADFLGTDAVIIPGVGAFGDGMNRLRQKGLDEAIRRYTRDGGHLLGICLGMQFLLSQSEELGLYDGLNLIPGRVVRLEPSKTAESGAGCKLPHIGWNGLQRPAQASWAGTILEGIREGEQAYFVHSYVAIPSRSQDVLATTEYGASSFACVIARGNVYGCQFHPEKSRETGIGILRNFLFIAAKNKVTT